MIIDPCSLHVVLSSSGTLELVVRYPVWPANIQVMEIFVLLSFLGLWMCFNARPAATSATRPNHPPDLWFVSETFGLEDFQLTGFGEPIDNDLGEPRSNCRNYIIRYFILSCVRARVM